MKIEIYCSMCGAEKVFSAQKPGTYFNTPVIDLLKPAIKKGWVVQQNGDNLDIYCSKRCAA